MLNLSRYDDLEIEQKREHTKEYIDTVKQYAEKIFSNRRELMSFLTFISYQFNIFNIWTLIYLYSKSKMDLSLKQGYIFFKAQIEENNWASYINSISDRNIYQALGTYTLEDEGKNKIFFYELINLKDVINITQDLAGKKLRYIDRDIKVDALVGFKRELEAKGYDIKINEDIKNYGGIIDLENKKIYVSRNFEDDVNGLDNKWSYYALWYLMARKLQNNMQLELEKKKSEIILMQKMLKIYCKVNDVLYGAFIDDLEFLGLDIWDKVINFETLYLEVLDVLKEILNDNQPKTA
ncbi:hypothetical protein [Mycoplasma sp. 46852]|uniref:hypothetical protein n=1 Tax=unclassified Mycoplasma TaxID=2683645 RepID=UPI003AAD8C1D